MAAWTLDKDNACERDGVDNIIVDGKMKVTDVNKGQVPFEQVIVEMRSFHILAFVNILNFCIWKLVG